MIHRLKQIAACLANEKSDSPWNINLLIAPKITDSTPSRKINISLLNIARNIKLTLPEFFIPQKIDVLLGTELFFELLNSHKIKLADNLFFLSTCFGYLVSGSIYDNTINHNHKYSFLSKNLEIFNKSLTSFWEIKRVENLKTCNGDELNYCNQHFDKTHFRKADGKYVLKFPFKLEIPETVLGSSKEIASKRLDYFWQCLEHDPCMKKLYTEFLKEY